MSERRDARREAAINLLRRPLPQHLFHLLVRSTPVAAAPRLLRFLYGLQCVTYGDEFGACRLQLFRGFARAANLPLPSRTPAAARDSRRRMRPNGKAARLRPPARAPREGRWLSLTTRKRVRQALGGRRRRGSKQIGRCWICQGDQSMMSYPSRFRARHPTCPRAYPSELPTTGAGRW
jgi:hypothetical protein